MHDANGLLTPVGIFWLYALGSALLTLALGLALFLFFKGRRDVDVDSSGALPTPERNATGPRRTSGDVVSLVQSDLKRSLEQRRRESAEGRPTAPRHGRHVPKSAA